MPKLTPLCRKVCARISLPNHFFSADTKDDIKQLINELSTVFDLSEMKHFEKHAGIASIASYRHDLRNKLKVTYLLLTDQFDFFQITLDEKAVLKLAITDNIQACTDGAQTRITTHLEDLFEGRSKGALENLDSVLSQLRHDLVRKLIVQYGKKQDPQSVHTYNRFFYIAKREGYGVWSRDDDPYMATSAILPDTIQRSLSGFFDCHYQAFGIMLGVEEKVREVFKLYGYTGRRIKIVEEKSKEVLSDSGLPIRVKEKKEREEKREEDKLEVKPAVPLEYSTGEYVKFINYVAALFEFKGADQSKLYEELILSDEEDHVYDFNWHRFRALLWETLTEKGYVVCSVEEKILLSQWVQSEIADPLLKLVEEETLHSIIGSLAHFDECLRLIQLCSIQEPLQKFRILESYCNQPGINLAETLRAAARYGDLAIIKILLAKKPSLEVINAQDYIQMTALMYAAKEGHAPIVEHLLDTFKDTINVSALSLENWTVLEFVLKQGHFELARRLIQEHKSNGKIALGRMAYHGSIDAVKELIKLGISPNTVRQPEEITVLEDALFRDHTELARMLLREYKVDGNLALQKAALHGRLDNVKKLIKLGVSFIIALEWAIKSGHDAFTKAVCQNCGRNAGGTLREAAGWAMREAVVHERLDEVKKLIEFKISPDIDDQEGMTALMHASQQGHSNVVQYLLTEAKPCASVHVKDQEGRTALEWALLGGHHELAKKLLQEHKANGGLALQAAAAYGRLDSVKKLIALGISADIADREGITALIYASCCGHAEIIRYLLTEATPRASINKIDKHGYTALECALHRGHDALAATLLNEYKADGGLALRVAAAGGRLDSVKKLMALGISCDITTAPKGSTALMYASHRGHAKVVQYLLTEAKPCASINKIDKHGYTALECALHRGHAALAATLLNEYKADGSLALRAAAACGRLDSVKKLIALGISADIADQEGMTTLMYASQQGHADVVQYLLTEAKPCAAIHAKDKAGRTALDWARLGGHERLVNTLIHAYQADYDSARIFSFR